MGVDSGQLGWVKAVQSPYCTEPLKDLELHPHSLPWLLQPSKAEILTWFGSHLQPGGHCRSAGQSWSSQRWHQESGSRRLAQVQHRYCPPTTFFPEERGDQMRMSLSLRDQSPSHLLAAQWPTLWEASETVYDQELHRRNYCREAGPGVSD